MRRRRLIIAACTERGILSGESAPVDAAVCAGTGLLSWLTVCARSASTVVSLVGVGGVAMSARCALTVTARAVNKETIKSRISGRLPLDVQVLTELWQG